MNSNKVIPDSNGMGSHGGQKKMGAVDKGGVKMVNKNYKTRHCNKYHSDAGCGRGEACHFIHDKEYKGRPVPEPDRPNRQHSKPPLITNYGGGNGYQNDRSRHSMQFGQPNSQYSHQQPSMGGGYYNPGMPASYPVSNVNSNFSISAQEGSALYSGMYKNAANYPINNGKSDKPAYNPMYGQIPMNGAQSNYMPSIGQPAPPPRK